MYQSCNFLWFSCHPPPTFTNPSQMQRLCVLKSKVHLLQKNNHIVGAKNAITKCLLPICILFQRVRGVSKLQDVVRAQLQP
jgi:hypothetical protein